mmetsp:Transcript_51676/g.124739  ORF Transcript_51676/g.124739 Transcript_51676/m.124739 type:complete len:215 (+) Transcript_51676:2620-3264(+)
MGTSSGAHSTPKSPRATMMPSHNSTIFSRASPSKHDGFSILAITFGLTVESIMFGWDSIKRLISTISSGRCTNDNAIQSIPPRFNIYSKSARSFGVRQLISRIESGVLTPFLSLILPATMTSQSKYPGPVSTTWTLTLPSSISNECPTSDASMISGCGNATRSLVPGWSTNKSKRNRCPFSSTSPSGFANVATRNFGPCKSPNTAMGWSYFCST